MTFIAQKLKKNENRDAIALSDLKSGEAALITMIADPQLKLALLRIGLLEGDEIAVTELAPWGGPMSMRVRGGKVAMRRSDAKKVQVQRIG